jgi:hypothetical protein
VDADGDGYTNREEFTAGTRPDDAVNPLKPILSFEGGVTVRMVGVAGRSYALFRTTSLGASWTRVTESGPLANDGPVELVDPVAPAEGAFYRTVVTFR